MVKYLPDLSIFTVFLKTRKFISKIRRSKVTDYAALNHNYIISSSIHFFFCVCFFFLYNVSPHWFLGLK